MAVEDPAYEDSLLPVTGRLFLSELENPPAKGRIAVEKVLYGDTQVASEVCIEFGSRALVEYYGSRWEVGSDGVWFLNRAYNWRNWDGRCCKLLERKFARAVEAIARIREGSVQIDHYFNSSDTMTWAYVLETVLWDKKYDDATIISWLSRMAEVAQKDKQSCFLDTLSDYRQRNKFVSRICAFDDRDTMFAAFSIYAAAEAAHARLEEDAEWPLLRTSRLLAYIGAEILSSKFSIETDCSTDNAWEADNRQAKGFPYCASFLERVLRPMRSPGELDEEKMWSLETVLEEFSSDEWSVREKAEQRALLMLLDDDSYPMVSALLKARENGNLEQKHRIELVLAYSRDKTRIVRLGDDRLPNLALLLHADPGIRQESAQCLAKQMEIGESISGESLEKRTRYVVDALEKIRIDSGGYGQVFSTLARR